MQTHARVVIIGGGIMGTSLLYHLAHEGWTDCVLLEKAELTSGATWHAAGQITHSTSNYALARMTHYGTDLYSRIEQETGQSVTFHPCGSLRLAYTDDEADWLHYTKAVGMGMGDPMEVISPDEIAKLQPFYKLDGVKAALWTPNDGHVDPAGAAFAFAKGARQLGAEIIRRRRATGVQQLESGEWRVETEQGPITCEHVVNAGGYYARQIGEWAGLKLPVTNVLHQYVITEAAPELTDRDTELPVIRDDYEVSGYVRQEQKSILFGIYEKRAPKIVWEGGTPWESENELFEEDYEQIMPWLQNGFDRMPIAKNLGVKRTVHGAIPATPDGMMLLGPAENLKNFWCCCGSHVGISWGPGAGKYLAQWMVHGAADINMRQFDPRRFGPYTETGDYRVKKCREDYILRHEIPFPHLDRPEARPVKPGPLYETLKARGAVFEEQFGCERPVYFARDGVAQAHHYGFRRPAWRAAIEAEGKAVMEAAGVCDLSAFAKLEIAGPDARAFLDRMTTNTLPAKDGGVMLNYVLNNKGTIESEVSAARLAGDRFYLVYAGFFALKMRDWFIRAKRKDENVTIADVSEDYGVLALSGPASRKILRQITQAPLDNAAFPWLSVREIDIAGAAVRAVRVSYTGELGWELHTPAADMKRVYDALQTAGRNYGLTDFGSFTLNALRLEKAYKGASEYTAEVTMPEAGAMRFCKLDKGEFTGRAATQASAERAGKPWVCVYFEVDAAHGADPLGNEALLAEGARIGAISSCAYGPRTGKTLGFGFVTPRWAAPGTQLQTPVMDNLCTVTILGEAVYDAGAKKPRADG
ncbi:MAG: GcvT family protein [Rhodospirillales bacterium]